MSEKQLREAMRYVRRDNLTEYSGLRVIEKALAKDPDLVELLRKIHEFQSRWSLSVPTVDALKLVARHIEKTVRLTDDGYEWIDE